MTKYHCIIAGLLGTILGGILNAEEVPAKPFNNDGVCETIVIRDGEFSSKDLCMMCI